METFLGVALLLATLVCDALFIFFIVEGKSLREMGAAIAFLALTILCECEALNILVFR
jgi:hypothetical protein